MKKLVLTFSLLFIAVFGSYGQSTNENFGNYESSYCSAEELLLRQSAVELLQDIKEWTFQYPSGTQAGGMKTDFLSAGYKSKYLTLFTSDKKDIDGKPIEYLRFSLDASDKGKSKNGSSVRAELRNLRSWTLSGKSSLSYTFFVTSTDLSQAKFTVGQFLQKCTKKDSPLCRIEVEGGQLKAKVVNYLIDGVEKADGKTWTYDLGALEQEKEVSIKINLNGKTLQIYRDDAQKVEHRFASKVSDTQPNYFKAGIYYQNKDSPKIFTEVFIKDIQVKTSL